jgi:predicted permease
MVASAPEFANRHSGRSNRWDSSPAIQMALLLLAAFAAVLIGYLVFRRMTRNDETTGRGIAAFAGET